jgi:hypothetical protein
MNMSYNQQIINIEYKKTVHATSNENVILDESVTMVLVHAIYNQYLM